MLGEEGARAVAHAVTAHPALQTLGLAQNRTGAPPGL